MSKRPLVCLLTDFGLKDNYVSAMKGVLLSASPELQIVDMTHEVPPQNVSFGAFQLVSGYKNFPEGTVFLCVVDPGVGGKRKIICAKSNGRIFVGPDNGLFSWVFSEAKPEYVIDISDFKKESGSVSQTFHGRDIMAPAVSAIINGKDPKGLGKAIGQWESISFPTVEKTGSQWIGSILAVDGYGNVITNIRTSELEDLSSVSKIWIQMGGNQPPIRGLVNSYSDVDKGRLLAIGGSSGYVEVAVRDGSAAKSTGLKEGDKITFQFKT